MTPAGRRRARELRILNGIAEALNSATDVQQALARTLSLVAKSLGLRTGWVWLIDAETQEFYSAAAQNLPPYLQEPVRMTGRSCWCIEAFRAGTLTPNNIDVMQCSRLSAAVGAKDVEATEGLRYHASIPLMFQDKPLGIMNVSGPSWRELSAEELRLLATIAYQVGIAVERARLAEERTRLARAEERTRLAREIHDTLAQGLTAIALHIEGAVRHLDSDTEKTRERLQRALAIVRENIEEARRSVLDLRATSLSGKPLTEALAAFSRAFASETGVRVQMRVLGARSLPLRVEAELFRIAQEALNNLRRHAKATEAKITLRLNKDSVRLTLRDNGQGFERRAVREGAQGLVGMRERAKLLGGTLTIESRMGQGTTVTATAPLPPDEV